MVQDARTAAIVRRLFRVGDEAMIDVVLLTFDEYDDYKTLGVFVKLKPFTNEDLRTIQDQMFREKPFCRGGVHLTEGEYLDRLRRDGLIGEKLPIDEMWVSGYCYPHPDADKHPKPKAKRGARGSAHD